MGRTSPVRVRVRVMGRTSPAPLFSAMRLADDIKV